MSKQASKVTIEEVQDFWNNNPLCATNIPYDLGSSEYFDYYDKMREDIEDIDYSYQLHEYKAFQGKMVLDVGCGNGYVLSKYAKEGAVVTGIDITETGIELCKKRFSYRQLNGNFLVADAQYLPFDDNTFDCVCSMGVLHHVPDTEKAVAEIFRVLKPGGRLIVMFYHKNSILYRINYGLHALFGKKTQQQLVNEFDGINNPKGYVYSKRELKKLLHQFVIDQMFVGYLTNAMLSEKFSKIAPKKLLSPLEKFFGWNLYAKGNKK